MCSIINEFEDGYKLFQQNRKKKVEEKSAQCQAFVQKCQVFQYVYNGVRKLAVEKDGRKYLEIKWSVLLKFDKKPLT